MNISILIFLMVDHDHKHDHQHDHKHSYHPFPGMLVPFLLQSLLCDPNPNSPANSEAAKLYGENRREYNKRVKEIVELSWMDSPVGTF